MHQQSVPITRLQREYRLKPLEFSSPQKKIFKEQFLDILKVLIITAIVVNTRLIYHCLHYLLQKDEQNRGKANRLPSIQFTSSEQNRWNEKINNTREKIGKEKFLIVCHENQGWLLAKQGYKNQLRCCNSMSKNVESVGYKLFAVCDGHGLNGHMVSNQIKQQLPKHLGRLLKDAENIENQIQKAFTITNRELWNSEIDTNLSGSTTVSLLITKDIIYSANVGDSRAIMCRFDDGWKVVPLSRDHKPDDSEEKNIGGRRKSRIIKDLYGNPIGPFRVWLSYIQAPGLAMSRSLGDKVGAQAGVTAEPEIKQYTITGQDHFIVVASDGVWEYLSNEEVMSIVIPYLEKDNPEQAAERIIIEATQAWRRNSLARDDITCIVIFLQK